MNAQEDEVLSQSLQLIVIHKHTFLSNASCNLGSVTSCDVRDFCMTADWLDLPTPLEVSMPIFETGTLLLRQSL